MRFKAFPNHPGGSFVDSLGMFIVLPSPESPVALGFAEVHNMGIGIPDSLGSLSSKWA